jgi:hypothetical protein
MRCGQLRDRKMFAESALDLCQIGHCRDLRRATRLYDPYLGGSYLIEYIAFQCEVLRLDKARFQLATSREIEFDL